VFWYIPREEIRHYTALTDNSLFYMRDSDSDMANKILSLGEAQNQKEAEFVNYVIRELLSAKEITKLVAAKVGNRIESRTIRIKGPVSFTTTTTRAMLHPENETRGSYRSTRTNPGNRPAR
jgi:hypothetical protein